MSQDQNEFSYRSLDERQPRYRGKALASRPGQEGRADTYRHVEPMAVVSLVLGGFSILPMFGWPMIVAPVGGLVFGVLALRRIEHSFGERTGRGIAIAGLVLSIVLGLIGAMFYSFFVVHGAPIGYTKVTFQEMQPNKEAGEVIPGKILELQDKFIFIRGYMYPGRRSMGIQQFVLVPTQAHCKFCQRDLASTEMIKVTMVSDELANYSAHMVGVGGKLKIDHQEAIRPVGGMPYTIEADVFRE